MGVDFWVSMKKAIAEIVEERDRAQADRDALLDAVEEHRAEKSHGPTANMEHADSALYSIAKKVRGEG